MLDFTLLGFIVCSLVSGAITVWLLTPLLGRTLGRFFFTVLYLRASVGDQILFPEQVITRCFILGRDTWARWEIFRDNKYEVPLAWPNDSLRALTPKMGVSQAGGGPSVRTLSLEEQAEMQRAREALRGKQPLEQERMHEAALRFEERLAQERQDDLTRPENHPEEPFDADAPRH